ncbi:3776_t:CDS:2, partial [Funneliformis caledonium]
PICNGSDRFGTLIHLIHNHRDSIMDYTSAVVMNQEKDNQGDELEDEDYRLKHI